MGCPFLLQGIFPTQGSILCLAGGFFPLSHLGSPLGTCRCTFDICWMNSVQELRGQTPLTALGSHGEEGSPILSPFSLGREDALIPGNHPWGDTSSANALCKCVEMDVFPIRFKTLGENRPS